MVEVNGPSKLAQVIVDFLQVDEALLYLLGLLTVLRLDSLSRSQGSHHFLLFNFQKFSLLGYVTDQRCLELREPLDRAVLSDLDSFLRDGLLADGPVFVLFMPRNRLLLLMSVFGL